VDKLSLLTVASVPYGARHSKEGGMNRIVLAALACIVIGPISHAQDYTSEELAKRTIHRRAVEAAIWGMPGKA
jgi:hypothetical protein